MALLARELGYEVTGSDVNVYPPMSTMLDTAGIAVQEGYSSEHLKPAPDLVVIGNALSRGKLSNMYLTSKYPICLARNGWVKIYCRAGMLRPSLALTVKRPHRPC